MPMLGKRQKNLFILRGRRRWESDLALIRRSNPYPGLWLTRLNIASN
jgi:hypothetical protein